MLDERWTSKKDRDTFTSDQERTLGEYVEKLNLIQIDSLSPELRISTEERIGELVISIAVSHFKQLGGCHLKHFSTGFEILFGEGQGYPELIALPLAIDARANEKARFDFLLRVQKADVGDSRFVVDRESLTFPAVIDCDLVSVDGFDDAGKGITFSFLSGEFVRVEGQTEDNDKEWENGFFHDEQPIRHAWNATTTLRREPEDWVV